jgi:hypothetical protein
VHVLACVHVRACACVQMCACACMRAYVWVHAHVYMAASARSPACLPLLLQANEFLSATRTVLEEEQQQALAAVLVPYSRCSYLIRLISTLGRAFSALIAIGRPKAWIIHTSFRLPTFCKLRSAAPVGRIGTRASAALQGPYSRP